MEGARLGTSWTAASASIAGGRIRSHCESFLLTQALHLAMQSTVTREGPDTQTCRDDSTGRPGQRYSSTPVEAELVRWCLRRRWSCPVDWPGTGSGIQTWRGWFRHAWPKDATLTGRTEGGQGLDHRQRVPRRPRQPASFTPTSRRGFQGGRSSRSMRPDDERRAKSQARARCALRARTMMADGVWWSSSGLTSVVRVAAGGGVIHPPGRRLQEGSGPDGQTWTSRDGAERRAAGFSFSIRSRRPGRGDR